MLVMIFLVLLVFLIGSDIILRKIQVLVHKSLRKPVLISKQQVVNLFKRRSIRSIMNRSDKNVLVSPRLYMHILYICMCVDQPTLWSVVVVVLRGRMAFGIEDAELEDIEVKLFTCAMQSDWEEVVRICEQHPSAHKAIIPASGETILYMAVLDMEEKIVEKLVEQISPSELDALKIGNEEGDTPLHLAASIGNVQMCKCITDKDRKLVGFPNSKAETPLFLAALRGQKEAFLFLHGMCESSERHDYCRRDDGRNILHCVIDEEYFDFAFQIIHQYRDLVDSVDENGLTPLHLLASKPTAFRSGTPLSWFERIIYHCESLHDLFCDSLI
ncbi:unnamed protein product, partial [Vitis vinifera]